MRFRSKKRVVYDKSIEPMLEQFRNDHPYCNVCGRVSALAIHEIARGAARKEARGRREALLRLCFECHEAMGDYGQWPIARQIAVKWLADWEWLYGNGVELHQLCVTINELRGRGPNDIEVGDVMVHMRIE